MAFRKVDPEFKFSVLKELWSGSKYTQISNKYGIPRATIYKWERLANEAVFQAFENNKPGKQTIDPKVENQQLRKQIKKLYQNKHKTAQDRTQPHEPLVCTNCGEIHIKKNGTVLTKTHGLRQRFLCLKCSFSIYVEVKKTLIMSNEKPKTNV